YGVQDFGATGPDCDESPSNGKQLCWCKGYAFSSYRGYNAIPGTGLWSLFNILLFYAGPVYRELETYAKDFHLDVLMIQALVLMTRPKWSQGTQRSVQPTVQIDGEKIIADLRSPIITPAMASLRQEVQAHLTEHIDSYDELLVQAAHKYYPLKRPTQPVLNEAEALANDARRLWSMFRSMRAHRHSIPGRQWAEFSRAHRIYKARAKQRSKQRKTDLLCQAQQAADKGNAHELWKTVKLLAPKAPKKGLQLHRGGHMITPEEELDWILEAYGERYATDNTQARIKFEFPEHAGFQLHSADLHWYLSHLNPRKAVPKGTAPAVVWKACADIISDPVINTFNAWQDGRPLVLQRWADADVALLPKAHGRSDSPLDWRPIGVQDPLGKCLMSTIILQAKSAIQCLLIAKKCGTDAPRKYSFYGSPRQLSLRINMEKTKAILKTVGTLKLITDDGHWLLRSIPTGAQVGELQKAVMKHTRAIISNQDDLRKSSRARHRLDQNIPAPDSDLDERYEWAPANMCAVWTMGGIASHHEETGEADMEEFFGPLHTGRSYRQEPQQPDLLITLARQVVKQEEEIKLLKQDHSLVLFFRPGEHTMLGFLYKTAKEFKAKQEANPQWTPGQQPLKAVMALALFTELGNRLQSVCQDQAKATRAKELGWRDPTVGWKYQRWNVQLKALEEDTSRPPLTDTEVATHIQKLCQTLGQDVVHRFHCTRRLQDTSDSPATFQMDLSVRTPAALEAWGALLALQGSTVLQLGGFAYKRESLNPSPAIAKLKDMLRGR
ncbi:unnamed protein product, partial [Symbiodinium microadriaticum]